MSSHLKLTIIYNNNCNDNDDDNDNDNKLKQIVLFMGNFVRTMSRSSANYIKGNNPQKPPKSNLFSLKVYFSRLIHT